MGDRAVDVLVRVLKGHSEAIEAMALDVDIDILVLVAAGDGCNKCWRDRLRLVVSR